MARVMCRIALAVVVVTWVSALAGCSGNTSDKKTVLWNGEDFTGWRRYVADPLVDVNDVWQIRTKLLYCSGQPEGYIRTEKEYKNYHLHVEWRWPKEPGNSGVFVHGRGSDKVWPACIECQLQAGNAGDFILMNGTGLTVKGIDRRDPSKQFVMIQKAPAFVEKAAGQWNTYDIYCKNGSIRCFVNGILQNEGARAKPNSGWIALQSEGSPVEFRNICLLPAE
jgi:hypothetical protein